MYTMILIAPLLEWTSHSFHVWSLISEINNELTLTSPLPDVSGHLTVRDNDARTIYFVNPITQRHASCPSGAYGFYKSEGAII